MISNSSRDHTAGTTIQFEGGRTLQFNKNEPSAASTVATTSSPSTASPSSQQSCSLSPDKPSTTATTTSLPSIYSSSSWTNSDYNKLKMEFEGGAPYSEYSKTLKPSSPPLKPISTNGSGGSGGAKVSFSVHAASSTKNSSIYNNSLHSINTSDTTLTGAVSLHDNLMLAKKKDPYKYYEVIKIMGTSSHNTILLHVWNSFPCSFCPPSLCTVGRR